MKSILKIVTLSCCLTALLVSCADDEFTRPTIETIAIQGTVSLQDEFKNPQIGDVSDILVRFKRRTTQVVSYETTTDANGEFELPDVIKSEYIIELSRSGYQPFTLIYQPPLGDVGNVVIEDLAIRQNSTTIPAITSITRDENFVYTISGTVSPAASAVERRGVLIVISNSADIPDPTDNEFNVTALLSGGNSFSVDISGFELLDTEGISSGQAYVHVFGLSATDEANLTTALAPANTVDVVTQGFQLNLN